MASTKYVRRCGKVRFPDRLAALLALASAGALAERGNDARREVRAYPCENCHGWHLTSKGRGRRRAA